MDVHDFTELDIIMEIIILLVVIHSFYLHNSWLLIKVTIQLWSFIVHFWNLTVKYVLNRCIGSIITVPI